VKPQHLLAALALSSVHQLGEAVRRMMSTLDAPDEPSDEDEFLAGVEVSEASWSDWEETSFDVRQFYG
jgi:hypothetical protein